MSRCYHLIKEIDTAIDEPCPIDIAKALDPMGGDNELLREVFLTFLGAIPDLLATHRSACTQADANQLKEAAHSLKGAASNICASSTQAVAQQLERIGQDGDIADAVLILLDLEWHLKKLEVFVMALVDTTDCS